MSNQSLTDDAIFTSAAPTTDSSSLSTRTVLTLLLFANLFCISLLGSALNVYVLLASFTNSSLTGFKYLVVLIGANNLFAGLSSTAVVGLQVYSVLAGSFLALRIARVILVGVIDKVPISVAVFQLAFTATKLYAVAAPLSYQQTFTDELYARLAVGCFAGYHLALLAITTIYPQINVGGSVVFVTAAICCDVANMAANLAIVVRLRFSVVDCDAEMREAIRANFWQSAVPFLISVPVQLAYLVWRQIDGEALEEEKMAVFVGHVYVLSVWSNLIVDPVSVLRCITGYRQQLMQLPACVRVTLFAVGAVMAALVLLAISGYVLALASL